MPDSLITRPLTDDNLFGYDSFGQLTLAEIDGEFTRFFHVADVRRKTCMICNHGWEPNGPSIANQYQWSLIDDYVHLSCFVRHLGLIDRNMVFNALCDARIRFSGLVVEPNGYWGQNDPWGKHRPWYSTELLDHPYRFLIGMRKHVWSIELRVQGSIVCGWYEAARMEFESEEVTKEFSASGVLIHAWSTAKIEDYIKRLARVGGLAKEKS